MIPAIYKSLEHVVHPHRATRNVDDEQDDVGDENQEVRQKH